MIILVIMSWIVFILISTSINKKDGFWLGLLFGPLGLIVSAILATSLQYQIWLANEEKISSEDNESDIIPSSPKESSMYVNSFRRIVKNIVLVICFLVIGFLISECRHYAIKEENRLF